MKVASIIAMILIAAGPAQAQSVHVGSKKFTESVILGEVLALLATDANAEVEHLREMGGTRLLFDALCRGDIDAYVEYTGTLTQEVFAGQGIRDESALQSAVAASGLVMSDALGFNNTYAIGMLKEQAHALGIATISDLQQHPSLALGLTNEFMDRGDGWPALRRRYALPQNARGLDHDLAYVALANGSIDAMDLYTTDAEIEYYDLAMLEDDLRHFPEYHAVVLYRADLQDRAPRVVEALRRLGGSIDAATMVRLNRAAKIDRQQEATIAAAFLRDHLDVDVHVEVDNIAQRVWQRSTEHLWLVTLSMIAAIVVSIPLGILAFRVPRWGQMILGVAGIVQTIPALALLVLLMTALAALRPLLEGIIEVQALGATPAIIALFLYSVLPILRNTVAGLQGIPHSQQETAVALGLSSRDRLRRIELPLASPTILAGIKTAAVINIGFATLGALIAAGGYGQPILTGIRLNDHGLILEGAIPAAVLAIVAQGLFELAERFVVPRGMRGGLAKS
jgi:osmoprotectant transport system permease protein